MAAPGPLNTICDVPGIRVGNAEDPTLVTGVTAILPDAPAVAAVSVAGGGPGTRGTTILGPAATMTHVHAVVLSGGSAHGLDAPGGAMDWLRKQGVGFRMGTVRVPIVPGAIIFDLMTGSPKHWEGSPWWSLGRAAAAAAATDVALGNAGAGIGARAGGLKGGLGSASLVSERAAVGALAVVNALGSTVVPGSAAFWAWPFERDGEFGGAAPPTRPLDDLAFDFTPHAAGTNTTLGVIATDATLTRAEAERVAMMAQDGIARAIRPAHSPLDGDTIFVLATGARPLRDPIAGVAEIGHLAADCLARAIARGVYAAEPLADMPSYRQVHAAALRSAGRGS
jgi:L-aminopeptidase/D-esterase-like protein